jgi:glucose/arabinose dehydrogenase
LWSCRVPLQDRPYSPIRNSFTCPLSPKGGSGFGVDVSLDGNRVTKYEPFAEGWLQPGNVWGRPADVLVMPDGALLVSDDEANVVYRISYGK